MNQSSYINKVKDIINSNEGDLAIVESIANLELSAEPTPTELLISGESRQIELVKELFETDDKDGYAEDPKAVAITIVSKLKSYISDFDSGVEYKIRFQLQATYQHFIEENIATEYLTLDRPVTAKSIPQALEEVTIWEKELPKKLPLFKNDKRECLLISIKPIYQVRALRDVMVIISDGVVEYGDERDINTRVNNL